MHLHLALPPLWEGVLGKDVSCKPLFQLSLYQQSPEIPSPLCKWQQDRQATESGQEGQAKDGLRKQQCLAESAAA